MPVNPLKQIGGNMDKEKRKELMKQGFIILREQFNHRINAWIIASLTRAGGWTRFGKFYSLRQQECQAKIVEIIRGNPEKYIMDV